MWVLWSQLYAPSVGDRVRQTTYSTATECSEAIDCCQGQATGLAACLLEEEDARQDQADSEQPHPCEGFLEDQEPNKQHKDR